MGESKTKTCTRLALSGLRTLRRGKRAGEPKTKYLSMNPKTIILTQPVLERCESLANSYTKETLCALGISYPPIQGWKRVLLGREILLSDYERALAGRSNSAKRIYPVKGDTPQLSLF